MKQTCSIFILFILLLLPGFLFTQGIEDNSGKPKIGVVLSGGGAKGMAHIGILKALENEGIKPDFIAGTSMGSIIGGLYSLGYSADQLDTIIRSVNWDLVLSNNIPLNYIAYEEKEYYNRYLFEFPIQHLKIKLPSGLIEGQMLEELLSRYTWPSKNYDSFDDFPIPFRCVATDVSTGKPIVFSKGSLAKALRASMAIPTAFTAVDLDSTLAVDGGVVNNFPVEELFNMGADYVIGVNVTHGFRSAYEVEGMTGILLQIAMIPSSKKLADQKKLCTIYITPDLENYTTASFSDYQEILEIGYQTGERYRSAFRDLADSLGIGIDQNTPKTATLHPDSVIIGSIKVTGNKLVGKNLILSKLQIREGDKVSRDIIEEGIRTIFGIMNFKKVNYELAPLTEKNTYELTVNVVEKLPASIRGSVHYDNIFKFGIAFNLTVRNVLGKSSRTILAGDISENPKIRFDYLKYIGYDQRFALKLNYNYLNERIPSYNEGLLKDIDISKEHIIDVGLMTARSLKNSVYFGMQYTNARQKQKFFSDVPEGIKYGSLNFLKSEILFLSNTFNDRNYPTHGQELAVIGQVYFDSYYDIVFEDEIDTVYFNIEVDNGSIEVPFTEQEVNDLLVKPFVPDLYGVFQLAYQQFINVDPKFQVIPAFSSGVTISAEEEALFNPFRIGGNQRVRYQDVRFLGLNYREVEFENYLLGSLFFQNVFLKNKLFFKYGINYLLPYEYVPVNRLEQFDFDKLISENSILGAGIEATFRSFIGPVSLGISRNISDSYFRYYLSVGFSFNYTD